MTPWESELEAICKRATPGPWFNYEEIGLICDSDGRPLQTGGEMCSKEAYGNAEHIATFNPATVLKLLDLIKMMKNTLEWIQAGANLSPLPNQLLASEALSKLKDPRER